jgi:hypothetical protein
MDMRRPSSSRPNNSLEYVLMDDPTLPPMDLDLPDYDPIAEIRDIRNWYAEQRAKYGMDWEDDGNPSAYNISRGLLPNGEKAPK